MNDDGLINVTDCVEGTEIRYGDLLLIGEQVLNYIAATKLGRWASPHGVTDYGLPEPVLSALLMRDFVVWTGSQDPEKYAEHRDRALAFIEATGWLHHCQSKLAGAS